MQAWDARRIANAAAIRSHETYADPCSCALLNFWDIKPREDATTCCQALQELCDQSNSTLHCGHVYRFDAVVPARR